MYRSFLRKNITSASIILFIILFTIIQYVKPAFLYEPSGALRQFGIGSIKENYYSYLVFDINISNDGYLFV